MGQWLLLLSLLFGLRIIGVRKRRKIVKQSLRIIISPTDSNGDFPFLLDPLHAGQGLTKKLVPVVCVLMQVKHIDHMMGHSFRLFLSHLSSHDGGVAVELL